MRSSNYVGVSVAAMCPARTREMVEDNLFWYEADVLRRMDVPMLKETWEEDRHKTIFYQRLPRDMKIYD